MGCKLWRPLIGIGIEAKATKKTKQYSAKLPERGRERGEEHDDNPERGELRAPYEIKESLRGRGHRTRKGRRISPTAPTEGRRISLTVPMKERIPPTAPLKMGDTRTVTPK